ncbi:MAG: ribonuclease III [Alphaproteobacteria bacterium]|nr:ribonuclease III [Alphaproteobacteria bacterium]
MKDLNPLEEKIGYQFKDQTLLKSALTHSSVRHSGNVFERLEFLGDRVLGVLIAEYLYKNFPKESEGDLAKRLAVLVSKETCNKVGHLIALSDFLKLIGDRSPHSSVLADAVEALIAALYLDGGLDECRKFVIRCWKVFIEKNMIPPKDAKTTLQEWAQAKGLPIPVYKLIESSGPDHEPLFKVEVTIMNKPPYYGIGSSKRIAEQAAASDLLTSLIK